MDVLILSNKVWFILSVRLFYFVVFTTIVCLAIPSLLQNFEKSFVQNSRLLSVQRFLILIYTWFSINYSFLLLGCVKSLIFGSQIIDGSMPWIVIYEWHKAPWPLEFFLKGPTNHNENHLIFSSNYVSPCWIWPYIFYTKHRFNKPPWCWFHLQ